MFCSTIHTLPPLALFLLSNTPTLCLCEVEITDVISYMCDLRTLNYAFPLPWQDGTQGTYF